MTTLIELTVDAEKTPISACEEEKISGILKDCENFCPPSEDPEEEIEITVSQKDLENIIGSLSHLDDCFCIFSDRCFAIQRDLEIKICKSPKQEEITLTISRDAFYTITTALYHCVNCVCFIEGNEILNKLEEQHPGMAQKR